MVGDKDGEGLTTTYNHGSRAVSKHTPDEGAKGNNKKKLLHDYSDCKTDEHID